MLNRIARFTLGSIFAIVPPVLFIFSIWFIAHETFSLPNSVTSILAVMACFCGALLFTPIGVIIIKGAIKNEPE